MSNPDLCTIAYQAEAYDNAAETFRRLHDYGVLVIPSAERGVLPFSGRIGDLTADPDTGEYLVYIEVMSEPHHLPTGRVALWNIYTDIDRIEVY